jgi:hypothetical protein
MYLENMFRAIWARKEIVFIVRLIYSLFQGAICPAEEQPQARKETEGAGDAAGRRAKAR